MRVDAGLVSIQLCKSNQKFVSGLELNKRE